MAELEGWGCAQPDEAEMSGKQISGESSLLMYSSRMLVSMLDGSRAPLMSWPSKKRCRASVSSTTSIAVPCTGLTAEPAGGRTAPGAAPRGAQSRCRRRARPPAAEPHLLGQAAGVKTGLESPDNTPPPTPTPPAPAGQQHLGKTPSGALGNGGIGQDSSKSKQRKRKKSAAACGMEAQSDAIQPSHIREAIRRYGHKIGPLSPFTSAYRRNGMTFLAC